MNAFLTDNFLLQSEAAALLYHEYAAPQPIIDFHNHLPPAEIAGNINFENLTKIWLYGDHYKWRAMRTLGIDEKFITGDASDKQKFDKWAQTVPYTIRNPLYHWTHLELKRYFNIDELLGPEKAIKIYNCCSEMLQDESFSTQNLIKRMNVELLCTTDDPVDSLEYHKKLRNRSFDVTVLPAFRSDNIYAFDDVQRYNNYLDALGEASGQDISTFDDLLAALENRIDYFNAQGCKLADHGAEKIYFADYTPDSLESSFKQIRSGKELNHGQQHALSYRILLELGKMYAARGWVQQYHLGALRETNDRMFQKLGSDTGFDSMGDFSQAQSLARFLNELDSAGELAKTILYNVNPKDNEMLATMTGNFNGGSVKGKMQFGTAWWFLDQKNGIEKQLNALSNMSLLSCFVGMVTDSRSFLSYPRHEYFRRVLCNLIGSDVEKGLLPDDLPWLGKIVEDICYHNAKAYFDFDFES